jgi:hypothetical protein
VTLYLRVRGAPVIAAVAAVVVALLAWPGSSVEATPSPTGATMMAGVFLAIAVPAAIGWGCARGDDRLEATGVRAIVWADLALAVVASAAVALVGGALHEAGMADAGIAAARATLTYLGLLLLAVPFVGWRLAPVAPALLLLAVAAFGRGEDIAHPAPWAWLAADGADPASWMLTAIVLVAGLAAYVALPRRLDLSPSPE